MKRSARKAKRAKAALEAAKAAPVTAGASANTSVAPIDWSAVPDIDPEKLQTGLYKFSGPEESRSQERMSHRELGHVSVRLRQAGTAWQKVRLWDFTSISFGVVLEPDANCWPAPAGSEAAANVGEQATRYSAGDELELSLTLPGGGTFEVWCQIKNSVPFRGGIKLGLRRLDVNFPQSVDKERREAFRLPLAPSLSLQARMKHPFAYGQWCVLSVSDMNRDMGLSCVSEDPSTLVFEGMEIQIHFELAGHRAAAMSGRITWVHATQANQVRFGVACREMPWSLHNGICDYLLFSRQWTPGRLRQAGFMAKQVKGRLRFRSVKTLDDYSEVLWLRRAAYVLSGKKPVDTRPEEMAGKLDGRSRILMAMHNETLVGSLTFTFPSKEEEILDSQAGFPGMKYPVHIPPKANLIEVSRLCIDEQYRGTDLLQGLFEHGVKHVLLSDRYWLLSSAVPDLLPIYEKIGFRKLGASYKHPALNNSEHHLILAHRDAFLWGKGMNLLVWNSLFADLINHLLERKLIKVPKHVAAIIRLKSMLAPLSKRLIETRAARAFRQHLDSLRTAAKREASPPTPRLPVDTGLEPSDLTGEGDHSIAAA